MLQMDRATFAPPNNAFSGCSHAIEHSRFEEKPKHEELQWLKP